MDEEARDGRNPNPRASRIPRSSCRVGKPRLTETACSPKIRPDDGRPQSPMVPETRHVRAIQPHAWAVLLAIVGLLVTEPTSTRCCVLADSDALPVASHPCCRSEVLIAATSVSGPATHNCCCREHKPHSPLIRPGTRVEIDRPASFVLDLPAFVALPPSLASATPIRAGSTLSPRTPLYLRLARLQN